MRAAILLAFAIVACTAVADDLDVIVDSEVSARRRGQAYKRLTSADFPAIAAKLATLIGTHPALTGIGPRTKQPWSEPQLSEGDRISCTLSQLWGYHMATAKTQEEHLGLMLTLLEDTSIGEGRYQALWEVSNRPYVSRDTFLTRLDRLACDAQQPIDLRLRLVTILFQHGDPNKYLKLAIELSATKDTPLQQGETFRFCTPSYQPSKLTEANRKIYVRHCFALLEKIDDTRSGSGYFLAMDVGQFLDIPPVRSGQGSFAPDQRLPQYQGPNGLTERFYQDTVDNARKWWNENNAQY